MNILTLPNPYQSLAESIRAPRPHELLDGCSILSAFAARKRFADEGEVAYAEYKFFTHHTYVFELLGLQLLGEMTAGLRSHRAISFMGAQMIDEARHVEAYRALLSSLSGAATFDDVVSEDVHHRLVHAGSLEEKLVRAFVVLESLAMGLFSARAKYFGGTAVASLDRRILHEESLHQANGIEIISDFMLDGRISFADVTEITRVTTEQVSELLSPVHLLAAVGLEADRGDVLAMQQVGMVGRQRSVTLRCIGQALRRIKQHTVAA